MFKKSPKTVFFGGEKCQFWFFLGQRSSIKGGEEVPPKSGSDLKKKMTIIIYMMIMIMIKGWRLKTKHFLSQFERLGAIMWSCPFLMQTVHSGAWWLVISLTRTQVLDRSASWNLKRCSDEPRGCNRSGCYRRKCLIQFGDEEYKDKGMINYVIWTFMMFIRAQFQVSARGPI